MTEITCFTEGKAIYCRSARIFPSDVPGKFVCRMQLLIGKQEIMVYFKEPEEMITYCRRHLFPIDINGYEAEPIQSKPMLKE